MDDSYTTSWGTIEALEHPDAARQRNTRMRSTEIFEIRQIDVELLRGERTRVLTMLLSAVPFGDVMEVGSTAVVGVIGKQDVDFAVRVPGERFAEARGLLDGLFARNEDQLANTELQGYVVPSELDLSVQLFPANGRYDTFEAFLRMLSNDAELRRSYNEMKLQWNGRGMAEYRVAKAAFIEAVLAAGKAPRASP